MKRGASVSADADSNLQAACESDPATVFKSACWSKPSAKGFQFSMSQDADMAAEAFRRGASAYLLKTCAASELTVAVREVLKGRSYLSPAIASDTVDFLLREGKVLVEEGDRR